MSEWHKRNYRTLKLRYRSLRQKHTDALMEIARLRQRVERFEARLTLGPSAPWSHDEMLASMQSRQNRASS